MLTYSKLMRSDIHSHSHAPLENKNKILTVSNSKPNEGCRHWQVMTFIYWKKEKLIKSRP